MLHNRSMTQGRSRWYFLIIGVSGLSLLLAVHAFSQLTKQSSPQVRQKSFETVWKTINDKYFDPRFGGVDWAAVRKQYEPQVATAQNDAEFKNLLDRMLLELKISHLRILDLTTLDRDLARSVVTRGVALRDLENQVVVTRVIDGSPAAAAGLRPGFIIKAIDQTPVTNARTSETKLATDSVKHRLTLVDETNATRDVEIGHALPPADKLVSEPILTGNRHVLVETRTVSDGIGYFHFTNFITGMTKRFPGAFDKMRNAPGIIIDLRGNSGGVTEVGLALAGMFIEKETTISVVQARKGDYRYKAKPQKNPYRGPVVILLDEGSASESEELTGGLQAAGRVVVIGRTSRGEDMDATFQELPMESIALLYPTGLPRTPKGMVIEGRGVTPHREIYLTREALLKGNDAQLEAAIQQIRALKPSP
jgi:carboxyl-terminal processing protease